SFELDGQRCELRNRRRPMQASKYANCCGGIDCIQTSHCKWPWRKGFYCGRTSNRQSSREERIKKLMNTKKSKAAVTRMPSQLWIWRFFCVALLCAASTTLIA